MEKFLLNNFEKDYRNKFYYFLRKISILLIDVFFLTSYNNQVITQQVFGFRFIFNSSSNCIEKINLII